MTEFTDTMSLEIAREIAAAIIANRIARGWSRQTILGCAFECGTTPCRRGFYLIRSGGIAVAPYAFTCFSEANGRGGLFSIRDLLPPLPDRTHAGTEELQPFHAGDKVWSWYKDEPNANYGLPDLPGDASNWRRRPRLFTVRSVSGPHTESGFCAGRPTSWWSCVIRKVPLLTTTTPAITTCARSVAARGRCAQAANTCNWHSVQHLTQSGAARQLCPCPRPPPLRQRLSRANWSCLYDSRRRLPRSLS